MRTEYKIETVGRQFIVVDPWDEIVGRYTSEEEAQQNIERFEKEHAVSETAHLLVENAIKALMQRRACDSGRGRDFRLTAEKGVCREF